MTQTATQQPFNPNEHVIKLKTKEGFKDYLPVQWRLVWFREQCPEGKITTEKVFLDPMMDTEEEGFAWNEEKRRSEKVMKMAKGFAVYHAHVEDGKGGMAEGTKSEKAAAFADYIEKAETGAIGRALAALGYGTQFAPDFEGDVPSNPVDSPVQRSNGQEVTSKQTTTPPANEKQLASIRKLCEYLGKSFIPTNDFSFEQAKAFLDELTAEYRDKRKAGQAIPAQASTPEATINYGKINSLLNEYKALRPDECKGDNWYWKVLRQAFYNGGQGVMPTEYTAEHVIKLSQHILSVRRMVEEAKGKQSVKA